VKTGTGVRRQEPESRRTAKRAASTLCFS
jgi:hypothetical protein